MALIRPEAELMRKYGLTDEELEQEFSEEHIQEITKFSWKEVGPRLQGIRYDPDVIDIDRDGYDQQDKRQRLLRMWKTRNGSDATYGALIRPMLKERKKDEAESICKLLRPPPEDVTYPLQSGQASASATVTTSSQAMANKPAQEGQSLIEKGLKCLESELFSGKKENNWSEFLDAVCKADREPSLIRKKSGGDSRSWSGVTGEDIKRHLRQFLPEACFDKLQITKTLDFLVSAVDVRPELALSRSSSSYKNKYEDIFMRSSPEWNGAKLEMYYLKVEASAEIERFFFIFRPERDFAKSGVQSSDLFCLS